MRLENFMTSCRDKLHHHTINNKIKFNFLVILFVKMFSSNSLPLSGTESEIEKLMKKMKNLACNHTLLNQQNQKFQFLMTGIL